ncbi:HD-GYP domain-containing protein [Gracilibacillus caseinilyticus]|uniref:HD-GYP domain-containing protein n=1 Tax=Gracilibacillus caseinilyticus TaxID=2932256 RepID=A0ABY4EVS8_9BACI|nr:HD-GYP domain-containing protein [Gracilibacillus caseinilyticus]UOQ48166.1 HD-GYP domain-containing protein [Gracilibacillus caseinilyticus]
MKLIPTKNIRPGFELAKPIYDARGRILVQEEIRLTQSMVHRLQNLGVTYVFIRDKDTEDIFVHPPIPDQQRMEAIQQIKETFKPVEVQGISNQNYLLDKTVNKLNHLVTEIAEELGKNEDVIHYLSDLLIIDNYVFSHSFNVSLYTLALAQEKNMKKSELEQLGLGAILHDIGKIILPDEILNKPGKLSDTEFQIVQSHTDYGFEMLRKAPGIPLLVAHCAFQHHERLDGSGYPRGITEDVIHPYARIIGVADVFDAVTSNRVYREALLPHEGLEILYSGAGTLFDKSLVETFKKTIALYPNGLTVQLSDGREGVVAHQNYHLLERPVVRILKENGVNVTPYDLDLAKVLNVMIHSHKQTQSS